MGWLRKTCFCAVTLVCMSAAADADVSASIEYMEPYTVEGLGVGMPVAPDSWQYKRYKCRPSEQYENSITCRFSEKKGGITILHLYNNIVTYINKSLSPALFTKKEVNSQIERLSRRFESPPHIYQSPKRPGFPAGGIIATWGEIELHPLTPNDLAILAQDNNNNPRLGFLVDYLMNFHESARAGLPVYSLKGGKGYVWIKGFDKKGAGRLRFLAADPSQMKLGAAEPPETPPREPLPTQPE
jgi:hypothetical protein